MVDALNAVGTSRQTQARLPACRSEEHVAFGTLEPPHGACSAVMQLPGPDVTCARP